MKKLLMISCLVFLAASGAYGQNVPYSDITLSSRGTPVGGAPIAVCGNPGLTTTAAQVISNIAVLTMSSNPITAGFVANQAIAVSGFTGADTYFNGGTVTSTGITNNFLILSVTSTQITYGLTHANASATTNGSVFQAGSQAQACAPLSSIFNDPAGASPITQPGLISTGLGNYQFYGAPNSYYVQFFGATIGELLKPVVLPPSTVNGTTTFNTVACKNINGFRCVDGTNFATVEAAQTDCQNDSTTLGCLLWVKSGFRETFTATINLGSTAKPTVLWMQPDTALTCNITNTTPCFIIGPSSGIVGHNFGSIGSSIPRTGTSGLFLPTTATISTFITTAACTNSTISGSIILRDLWIEGDRSGTPTVSTYLDLCNLSNFPTIENVQLGATANSLGVAVRAPNIASGFLGPIKIKNLFASCRYQTGCQVAKIDSDAGANSTVEIDWDGGWINQPGAGQTGLEINGGGSNNNPLRGVTVKAYMENNQGGGSLLIKLVDAYNVNLSGMVLLAQATDTCVDISQTSAGRSGAIHIGPFSCSSAGGAAPLVVNHITSQTVSASKGHLPFYNFGGDSTASVPGFTIDGNFLTGPTLFGGSGATNVAPPTTAPTNSAWRTCLYSNQVCDGIAPSTLAHLMGGNSGVNYVTWFPGNTTNNTAGANTPDATGTFSILNTGPVTWHEVAAPGTPSGQGTNFDSCYGDSTTHALKCSYNNGTYFPQTQTIGTGNVTTAGTAINTLTCQAQTGITVTGAQTTDNAIANIGAALPATWQTGIAMQVHVTATNTVTVYLCNPTATATITPIATQVNVRVVR